MRFAVLADIHGNALALEAVLKKKTARFDQSLSRGTLVK